MQEPNLERLSDIADVICAYADVERSIAEETARAILFLPEIAEALEIAAGTVAIPMIDLRNSDLHRVITESKP